MGLNVTKLTFCYLAIRAENSYFDSFYPLFRSYSGYDDELAWASAWLYYATKENQYKTDAEGWMNSGMMWGSWEFSWDNKRPGAQVSLGHATTLFEFYKAFLPTAEKNYSDFFAVYIK